MPARAAAQKCAEPDPVVRAYLKGIDRTLLAKNLALTPDERLQQLMALQQLADEPTSRTCAVRRQVLPFVLDVETLSRGLNFTLTSKLGDVDLLGEIVVGGGYAALEPHCVTLELFGVPCLVLGLDKLIEVKRAAGRPKDLESLAELVAIRGSQR